MKCVIDWLFNCLGRWETRSRYHDLLKATLHDSNYSLVNSPLVSLNSLMSILPIPYVYEPKPISQVWLSNGQLPISNLQLALNVAGPLHTLIPVLSTDTSVTNFVRPPARVTLSSPLKSTTGLWTYFDMYFSSFYLAYCLSHSSFVGVLFAGGGWFIVSFFFLIFFLLK